MNRPPEKAEGDEHSREPAPGEVDTGAQRERFGAQIERVQSAQAFHHRLPRALVLIGGRGSDTQAHHQILLFLGEFAPALQLLAQPHPGVDSADHDPRRNGLDSRLRLVREELRHPGPCPLPLARPAGVSARVNLRQSSHTLRINDFPQIIQVLTDRKSIDSHVPQHRQCPVFLVAFPRCDKDELKRASATD